ncbi:glycosylphosphatidylinositol anchor attachment 1 protein [Ipomoea triloba]|uniref:glycosylphosphatidylinositol anchor attachment 1 protein n=1 Tax=Ipomoea triloba TaxID=35885 RepID=UPI00125E0C25|nr:glycosylphosphatidylinositol anchor attachment 1 protein [Ipomoea triloba]XP_031098521.1 glycosylphosphatidylinositol anchor attachment 1 protein [Ipomoea triloba]
MAKTDPTEPKPRPIIRIGLLLVSHSLLVSVVCCTAGVLALLLLPVLAKNTYISENALMPGSASPMLSHDDVSQASRFVNNILSSNLGSAGSGIGIPGIIAQHIKDLGGEVNFHKFQPQVDKFQPLRFFSSPDPEIVQENYSCSTYGINTVGIIRAPRGDGKEAIVLVTPYNSMKVTAGEALSLGIGYSVFSLLTRVTWLAKDIIWLAADSQLGDYAAVASWLRDYHTPSFGDLGKRHSEMCYQRSLFESSTNKMTGKEAFDGFRRAGTMAAALVIKFADASEEVEKDALYIYPEASNGQMPNLDLINIVNYLAVHGQGFRVKVEKLWSLLDSGWLKSLGKLIESLGKVAKTLNPQWNFAIPVAEYVEGTATLASSLYSQALGIPTGPHGAFRDFQVDAITMKVSPKHSSYEVRQNELLLRGGRLVEGVIRCVNNLLEKFHQSFFLYLLTSPNRFVSVGVYMIAFALLISPLPLVAASLFINAGKLDSNVEKTGLVSLPASANETAFTFKSWKWLNAAKTVFVVHLWGAIVTLLPQFFPVLPDSSIPTKLLIWVSLSLVSLLILQVIIGSSVSFTHDNQAQRTEWALLKSVTIAAAFIGLCLMSVINFATAEIGAVILVPMCLMARPLRLDARAKTLKAFTRAACNLFLLLLGFPPVAFIVFKGLLEGFNNLVVSDLWNWVESLWMWGSATYIYICMVHIPCWVLCIRTLLHNF